MCKDWKTAEHRSSRYVEKDQRNSRTKNILSGRILKFKDWMNIKEEKQSERYTWNRSGMVTEVQKLEYVNAKKNLWYQNLKLGKC